MIMYNTIFIFGEKNSENAFFGFNPGLWSELLIAVSPDHNPDMEKIPDDQCLLVPLKAIKEIHLHLKAWAEDKKGFDYQFEGLRIYDINEEYVCFRYGRMSCIVEEGDLNDLVFWLQTQMPHFEEEEGGKQAREKARLARPSGNWPEV